MSASPLPSPSAWSCSCRSIPYCDLFADAICARCRAPFLAVVTAPHHDARALPSPDADGAEASAPAAAVVAPALEAAPAFASAPPKLEDLARRMARTITNPGEARALASRLPGLTSEERLLVLQRWAQIRQSPPEHPSPSRALSPSAATAADTPATRSTPQGSVNIPAALIGTMGAVDLHVLIAFITVSRRRPSVTVPLEAIEELTSIPRRSLVRAVARLDAEGHVTREQPPGKATTYTVTVMKSAQFIRVPVALLSSLDSEELAQYLALRAIVGRFDTCARPVAELAQRAGLSVRVARRTLGTLRQAELLVVRRHLYRESTYLVLQPPAVPDSTGGRATSGRGSCQPR